MLAQETSVALPEIPDDLEEVEYPPEVVERWDREFEIVRLQLATGELVPQTVEELAAELGIPPIIPTEKQG